jgi:hypothetical protein
MKREPLALLRALSLSAWNVLAVHGLFHLQGWPDVRDVAVTVGIAGVVTALMLLRRRAETARNGKPTLH